MVSPLGPNPSVCFMLPYLLAIPAAKITNVGALIFLYLIVISQSIKVVKNS
jgi:hypothetical protein